MTIPELAPYLQGKEKMEAPPNYRLMTSKEYTLLEDVHNLSRSAAQSLGICNTEVQFFSKEKDLAYHIDPEIRTDFFYSLKRGKVSEEIPSILLYHLDFIKSNGYSYNELMNLCTGTVLKKMLSPLSAISVRDIILNHYDENFKMIESHRLKVPMNGYYEVYVPHKNRVAFIMNEVATLLSEDDILELKIIDKTLCCRDTPVSKIGGRLGVTRGLYDLRSIL